MKTVTIEGHLRTEAGKKVARQLRSQENVLGVIYGGATEVNFYASAKAFKPLVYTSEFQLAEVTVEGKTYKCILKDLQFDKVSDALIHVDLLELVDNKKVIATLPLKLVGAAAGIKAGGKLVVKGNVDAATEALEDNFLFKGIATRAFTRAFAIDDHIEVKGAELFNGMLKIALERLVPDQMKPKKVPVNTRGKKQLLREGSYDEAAERL